MFDGGGFGVGLTVAEFGLDTGPMVPGQRAARLIEVLPVASRSAAEVAAELVRVQQLEGALAAYKLDLVAGLAAHRPDSQDRRPDQPGAASPSWSGAADGSCGVGAPVEDPVPGLGAGQLGGVSEFFADELAMVLNCSRSEATRLADAALLLGGLLRSTWEALADGRLDWPRARAIAAELLEPAGEVDPRLLTEVEAAVLPQAARLSVPGVRAAVRRELLARDAAAADRRRARATLGADVTTHPLPDGMAELRAFAPLPQVRAMAATIEAHARVAKQAGAQAPIGVLRVEALFQLVTRAWDTGRESVTAVVQVIAPLPTLRHAAAQSPASAAAHAPRSHRRDEGKGCGAPVGVERRCPGPAGGCPGCGVPAGEVDGQPITAAHLRELLEQLDALCPGGLQAPAGGRLEIALVDPVSGRLRATVTRGELARLARRGCPNHPDAGAAPPGDPVVAAGSGAACGCPVLDRPPQVGRYRHSAAQERFVTVRDRTCRHPGCRTRAGWADLDHVLAHACGGPTDCTNLCCLCRRHHRLKTHARGWAFTMTADGTLTVTTPSGITRVTRPPGQAPPADPGDDPPPF